MRFFILYIIILRILALSPTRARAGKYTHTHTHTHTHTQYIRHVQRGFLIFPKILDRGIAISYLVYLL